MAVMVEPVGLAPQLSGPFARLLEQHVPGDRPVLGQIEQGGIGEIAHRRVEVRDHTAVEGEAEAERQIALRGAERHVRAVGRAPFGDDLPVPHHEAALLAARLDRPDDLVVGRRLVHLVFGRPAEVPRPARLARARIIYGRGEGLAVHADGLRRGSLPAGAGRKIDSR